LCSNNRIKLKETKKVIHIKKFFKSIDNSIIKNEITMFRPYKMLKISLSVLMSVEQFESNLIHIIYWFILLKISFELSVIENLIHKIG
jgi:hypothetical protein